MARTARQKARREVKRKAKRFVIAFDDSPREIIESLNATLRPIGFRVVVDEDDLDDDALRCDIVGGGPFAKLLSVLKAFSEAEDDPEDFMSDIVEAFDAYVKASGVAIDDDEDDAELEEEDDDEPDGPTGANGPLDLTGCAGPPFRSAPTQEDRIAALEAKVNELLRKGSR